MQMSGKDTQSLVGRQQRVRELSLDLCHLPPPLPPITNPHGRGKSGENQEISPGGTAGAAGGPGRAGGTGGTGGTGAGRDSGHGVGTAAHPARATGTGGYPKNPTNTPKIPLFPLEKQRGQTLPAAFRFPAKGKVLPVPPVPSSVPPHATRATLPREKHPWIHLGGAHSPKTHQKQRGATPNFGFF